MSFSWEDVKNRTDVPELFPVSVDSLIPDNNNIIPIEEYKSHLYDVDGTIGFFWSVIDPEEEQFDISVGPMEADGCISDMFDVNDSIEQLFEDFVVEDILSPIDIGASTNIHSFNFEEIRNYFPNAPKDNFDLVQDLILIVYIRLKKSGTVFMEREENCDDICVDVENILRKHKI